MSRTASDGATQHFGYDGEGNQTTRVDALGRTSVTEYGAFDLPVAAIDPTGARTSYGYDTELRLTSVTNPRGLVWQYEYDPAGRLARQRDFDGRQLHFRYDAAGQLVESVNSAGEATTYGYDAVGNMVERRAASGVTHFGYDAAGRLIRATSADVDLTIERDRTGRIVAETCNGASVTMLYDRRGRLIARRTPAGGSSVWTYDAAGNPTVLRAAVEAPGVQYDQAGRETSRRLDPTFTLRQRFDTENRLTAQALSVGAGAAERTIEYDQCGDLIAIHDQRSGSRRFGLDPLGRVSSVDGPQGTERYGYDDAGNLARATWQSTTGTVATHATGEREFTANQLVRAGEVRYRHDDKGRLVARTVGGPPDRPVSVTDTRSTPGTPRTGWSPLSRRTGRAGATGTTRWADGSARSDLPATPKPWWSSSTSSGRGSSWSSRYILARTAAGASRPGTTIWRTTGR